MLPPVETCTKSVPIIGPVHEKETITKVNAIRRMLISPDVLSALLSNFVLHVAGKVRSKPPKKEIANITNKAKINRLKIAFVDSEFKASAPNSNVIKIPKHR
jgi:hypothetical protein